MNSAAENGPNSAQETKSISAAASVSDEPNTPPPAVASSVHEDTKTPPKGEQGTVLSFSTAAEAQENSIPLKREDDQTFPENTEMKAEPRGNSNDLSDSKAIESHTNAEKTATPSTQAASALGVDASYRFGSPSSQLVITSANGSSAPISVPEPANNLSVDQKGSSATLTADAGVGASRDMIETTTVSDPRNAMASSLGASVAEDGPTQIRPTLDETHRGETTAELASSSMKMPGNPIETTAESSQAAAKRSSVPQPSSAEREHRARQEESMRIQKENEDMRLQWLSLPANDHITYYSDTEDDASSDPSDAMAIGPAGAFGGMPHFTEINTRHSNNRKRNRQTFDDERESSDSDDEKMDQEAIRQEHQYRTGNRGNKLLKNSRWIRRGKLGIWTEAKTEKDYHDRFMTRVKAIQRAGVESLLHNAPGPKVIKEDGSLSKDMLEGNDRLLLRDVNKPIVIKENLYSTSLAPALLRPILSARALLESHTLRHTFRNPHIGALSKTALDLRESESQLAKALGRCFAAMERTSAYIDEPETGQTRVNGSQSADGEIDVHVIGAENTAGTADEVNPALYRLENLFITKKGLPIPVSSGSDNESQSTAPGDPQAILSTTDQRNVVRAALECLTDLAADSLEYVERLEEVRGRLESAKRQRTQVWEALRLWAVKREFGEEEEEEEVVEEMNGIDPLSNRPTTKPGTTNVSATTAASRRRR